MVGIAEMIKLVCSTCGHEKELDVAELYQDDIWDKDWGQIGKHLFCTKHCERLWRRWVTLESDIKQAAG